MTTLKFRRAMRDAAGAPRHVPIEIVEGYRPPTYVGRSYYFTTPSGKTVVHHPNAYGWRTRYWPSTLRVVVGRESLQVRAWTLLGHVAAE